MASSWNAAYCALAATAFWTLLGMALVRKLLPKALALGAGPSVSLANRPLCPKTIHLTATTARLGEVGGLALSAAWPIKPLRLYMAAKARRSRRRAPIARPPVFNLGDYNKDR